MLLNLTPRNHTKATWLMNTGASSSNETAGGKAAGTASNKMKMDPRTLSPRVLHRGTLLELIHHWLMDGDLQIPPKGSEKLVMMVPTGGTRTQWDGGRTVGKLQASVVWSTVRSSFLKKFQATIAPGFMLTAFQYSHHVLQRDPPVEVKPAPYIYFPLPGSPRFSPP